MLLLFYFVIAFICFALFYFLVVIVAFAAVHLKGRGGTKSIGTL